MTEEYKNKGQILNQWHFPETAAVERSRTWYIVVFIAAIALIFYAMVTANFLFAVIVVMVVIILLMNQRKQPLEIDFKIREGGLEIGEKFYPFKDLDKFFIIYEPPEVSSLYFEFKNRLKPRLSIPLQDQNPVKVRDLLLEYLIENVEAEEEPLSDYLTRFLKF